MRESGRGREATNILPPLVQISNMIVSTCSERDLHPTLRTPIDVDPLYSSVSSALVCLSSLFLSFRLERQCFALTGSVALTDVDSESPQLTLNEALGYLGVSCAIGLLTGSLSIYKRGKHGFA